VDNIRENPLVSGRCWHEHKAKRLGIALAVRAQTPMNILSVYPFPVRELERIRERH
jgi:hypothetical protein